MSLNKAQKQAVMHFQGPCMVLAGPGSGKTLTIAKRIEYLIKVYKVRPEEILVITFTRYAANEMKNRFCAIMGSSDYPVNFGTFHSVYYWILRWAYNLAPTCLLSENEKYLLLRQAVQKAGEEENFPDEEDLHNLAEEISVVKNDRKDIGTYKSRSFDSGKFREIYHKYEEEKSSLKKIDFEDMLLLCCRLFEERKDILRKWQEKFRYILVDEFQDINQVQYDVIRMLAEPGDNLFVVGDDDQSIYGFRGAKPGIMMKFMQEYPGAKRCLLNINYRSGAYIVNSALRVIENNRQRYQKEIHAAKKPDKTVHIQEVRDPVEESEYITDKIREITQEGTKPEDIAILFRTAADARILTETLVRFQIPFRMKEQIYNIYDHFIAQDLISYLCLSQRENERRHFIRIANRPNRYISRDSMSHTPVSYESIRRFYCDKRWMLDRIDQLEWDVKMISGKTPYAAIQYIRKSIGYEDFLREYADYQGMECADLIETLDRIQESSRGFQTILQWLEHIEEYTVQLREKAFRRKKRDEEEGIVLCTMHGAKGLEYDTVFITGANDGIMPYKRARLAEEVEEERRLFYVAMTRAKRQLIISYTKERNGKNIPVSRFVYELTGSQNRKNDVK